MNVRGAALQSGLAALGLIVAYGTWQREPERAPGEVTVIDASKSELKRVRFDDGSGKWVELTRRSDGEEPRVWLKLSGDATKKTPERELPGNEGAERLWDKFAPLHATRALGTLSADKLKEVGLDGAKKRLEVDARGDKTVFVVGNPPFGGVSDPYVRNEHDQKVYVLGNSVLGDLESASVRLIDRTLHGFKAGDFDGITVAAGGKTRELSVPPVDNPAQAKVLTKAGKPDDMAKNWHDKMWRQFVTDVLGKDEKPAGGAPEVACKLTYTMKGKQKGFIELGRVTPPPTQSTAASSSSQPAPAAAPEVWARSEHSAGWDKLPSAAEELVKECAKVAAGD
jgi:hypothetical protein